MTGKPLGQQNYEQFADRYRDRVDTKPHNAYYERPATLSLLPDVRGKQVFDAGCGPGVYSEWLLRQGATVFAADASANMVALAQRRLGTAVTVQQMDLGRPLTMLADASFDLVISPLVLDYIRDWDAVFAEFYRVLKPGGHFVFSVGHAFADFQYFKSEEYFATEQVSSIWRGFGEAVRVPTYRRPLSEQIRPLLAAGFILEVLHEPQPTEDFMHADPEHYAELMRQPVFICFRAQKQERGSHAPA